MNSAMTLPITLLASLAFAGCASGPRVSTSGIVQTLQVGDAQRRCEALRAEVSELDEAPAAISRNEQANAFAGATNSFNNPMGGSARFAALNAMQGFSCAR